MTTSAPESRQNCVSFRGFLTAATVRTPHVRHSGGESFCLTSHSARVHLAPEWRPSHVSLCLLVSLLSEDAPLPAACCGSFAEQRIHGLRQRYRQMAEHRRPVQGQILEQIQRREFDLKNHIKQRETDRAHCALDKARMRT